MIMSKTDENTNNAFQYLEKMLGAAITAEPLEKSLMNIIPVSISNNYKFYSATLLNTKVCFLYSLDSSAFTPAQLQKQCHLMENKLSLPVIFIFENVVSYNIQRLVAQRINFVVAEKQMFIPDLLIDLKKQKTIVNQTELQIPPMAQCILLYHLEKASLNNKTTREIAYLFQVSYANANRAIRWLTDNNIATRSDTKEKYLNFPFSGKDLWNKALPYLVSPVDRIVYTDQLIDNCCIGGINALSIYTMLNDELKRWYAISKEDFKKLTLVTDKEYGENLVEIWRYDPQILADNHLVDKLSLYLSLKDTDDERIQIELENMINNIVW